MAAVNPLGRDSVLGLKDIVRLVEDDLARVEEVFRAQVPLRRAAGGRDRPLHPGGRGQARAPGAAAARGPALRLPGRAGGDSGLHRRVHPHREPPARRHHRRGHHPPRPPQREQPLGQRHHRSPRRLPLHEVDGHGALAGQLADPAPPLRRDAPPHRGRDPRDRAERQPAASRRRTTSTRSAGRRPTSSPPAPASGRSSARWARSARAPSGATASTSASASRWWTTSSTSRRRRRRSASPWRTTCARARSPCP